MLLKALTELKEKLDEPAERLLLAFDLLQSIDDFYAPTFDPWCERNGYYQKGSIGAIAGPLNLGRPSALQGAKQNDGWEFAYSVDPEKVRFRFSQMRKRGLKFEIDALSAKGLGYLAKSYLPAKLTACDWLD